VASDSLLRQFGRQRQRHWQEYLVDNTVHISLKNQMMPKKNSLQVIL
jgi:hypothetical protein